MKFRIFGLLFPQRCPFCRKLVDRNHTGICDTCRKVLPFTEKLCLKCGKPKCICHRAKLYYDSATAPLVYEHQVIRSISRFKSHCKTYSEVYALLMFQRLVKDNFFKKYHIDCIAGVPGDLAGYLKRGYSQTALLARDLSKIVQIPWHENALKKVLRTKKQKGLNEAQRRSNLKGAFRCIDPESVYNRNILLCDDVLTTGSTLSEAAYALKSAGAKQVHGVTIATSAYYLK